mmetsp:Transcript_5885/g.6404  ORF Transcript_5885/g.6404 Transcript_5885/m.6404 type:complete len:107 (+) Transcript_5885:1254-1574(+)
MGITSSSFYFEDTVINGQEGYIESTTTEIEDKYVLLTGTGFIQTVCDSSGSWFVDDTQYVKTRDSTGIFCSLSLGVVKVSWDCDNSRVYGVTQEVFSNILHFVQDH